MTKCGITECQKKATDIYCDKSLKTTYKLCRKHCKEMLERDRKLESIQNQVFNQ